MIKTFFQFEKKQTLLYILKYIKQKAAQSLSQQIKFSYSSTIQDYKIRKIAFNW